MKSVRQQFYSTLFVLTAALPSLASGAYSAPKNAAPASTHPASNNRVQTVMLNAQRGWAVERKAHGYAVQKTSDGGRSWQSTGPSGFWPRLTPEQLSDQEEVEDYPTLSFPSPNMGAVATLIDDPDGNAQALRVALTVDGGGRWQKTQFRVPNWAEYMLLQWIDLRHGVLLVLSGPAAGLMEKQVYRTSDGNRSWQLVNSGVYAGSFYPTGMIFRNAQSGWVGATYHGRPDVPLFRTRNGGRTWHLEELPEPAVYRQGGYGNTYPPHFFGPQRREGTLTVDYRNSDAHRAETIVYVTHDGGGHWAIAPPARRKHL